MTRWLKAGMILLVLAMPGLLSAQEERRDFVPLDSFPMPENPGIIAELRARGLLKVWVPGTPQSVRVARDAETVQQVETVKYWLFIDEAGRLVEYRPDSEDDDAELRRIIEDALPNIRYRPGMHRGEPVGAWVVVEFVFRKQTASPQINTRTLREWERYLAERLAPLDASIDSMVVVLRPDSATLRADSAFLSFREFFRDQVYTVARALDDLSFQIAVYPGGAAAQRLRREQGSSRTAATPSERALGDSLMTYLRSQAVWPQRAEGDVYLSRNETELLRLLGPFLSDPLRGFQTLAAMEQRTPSGGDGALTISWDALGRRVASAERVLLSLSGHPARAEAEETYRHYMSPFLYGWPNSRAFDWSTQILRPEVRQSLESYAHAHRDRPSGLLVAEYLRLLEDVDYRDGPRVREFMIKEGLWD